MACVANLVLGRLFVHTLAVEKNYKLRIHFGFDHEFTLDPTVFHCFPICSYSDTTQSKPNSKEFWVNMPNLMTHLKKVAEQKPQATYYNVDMLKYQVRNFFICW